MLTKSVPLKVQDMDTKQGIFTGYFSVFGTPDDGDPPDIVEPGAFVKTFAEWGPGSTKQRIKLLWMHDPFSPVGKPLKLEEHAYGAYHETKLADTQLGRDCLALVEEGVITEMSFGYDALKASFDKQAGARRLKEIRCWEYSLVTWGLHPGTMTLGTKGLPNVGGLADQMARVEKVLRRGNLQSDDLMESMELALKQWQHQAKELEIKAQPAPSERETIDVVPPTTEQPKGGPALMENKAPDFQTILVQATTEENLRNEWWILMDAIRTALRGTLADVAVTDKAAAASASLDQFKVAMLSWMSRAAAVSLWSNQQKAAEFLAGMETKAGSPEVTSTKAGRVISEANRKKITECVGTLTESVTAMDSGMKAVNMAVSSLQALMEAAEPAEKATPGGTEPPKTATEPGNTTPADDPELVKSVEGLLATMRNTMKGVS